MFWTKKITKKKWVSTLDIKLTNNQTISWSIDIIKDSKRVYWKHFLKWYYGRPQSTVYTMKYKNGSHTIKRCNIYSFEIRKMEI